MNSIVPAQVEIIDEPSRRARAKPHGELPILLNGLASLDDATSTIARILLSELGKRSLEFPLLQTKIITASDLLQYKAIRSASAGNLRPDHFLRERIEILKNIRVKLAQHDTQSNAEFASSLLDIIEIREWLDRKRSRSPLAWMVRPGQWTFWGLSPADRAMLGLGFEASLELECRVTAELAIAFSDFIGIKLLPHSRTGHIKVRLGTLMDIAAHSSGSTNMSGAAHRTLRERCFDALRALEQVGVLSNLKLPTPKALWTARIDRTPGLISISL